MWGCRGETQEKRKTEKENGREGPRGKRKKGGKENRKGKKRRGAAQKGARAAGLLFKVISWKPRDERRQDWKRGVKTTPHTHTRTQTLLTVNSAYPLHVFPENSNQCLRVGTMRTIHAPTANREDELNADVVARERRSFGGGKHLTHPAIPRLCR